MSQKKDKVNQLTSRHIARCLAALGDTLAPVQVQFIKRSFRFLATDIVEQVIEAPHE